MKLNPRRANVSMNPNRRGRVKENFIKRVPTGTATSSVTNALLWDDGQELLWDSGDNIIWA